MSRGTWALQLQRMGSSSLLGDPGNLGPLRWDSQAPFSHWTSRGVPCWAFIRTETKKKRLADLGIQGRRPLERVEAHRNWGVEILPRAGWDWKSIQPSWNPPGLFGFSEQSSQWALPRLNNLLPISVFRLSEPQLKRVWQLQEGWAPRTQETACG